MIRVLIAEDSPSIAAMMRDLLGQDPEIEVVGWAKNGREAIELRNSLEPDVITMDLDMPIISGLEAIKIISATRPAPILVVSQKIESRDSEVAFEALRSGAVDIMTKPSGYGDAGLRRIKEEMLSRIRTVARIRPIRLFKRPLASLAKPKAVTPIARGEKIIAIGASTGGPPALSMVLRDLPPDFPCPIAVVQHIAPGFVQGLVAWLHKESPFVVKIATTGEPLKAGTVYLAPDDLHLEVANDKTAFLSNAAPVRGHRPSVDRLMESIARFYGKEAVGVLLTGMGSDGAEGLRRVREAGGKTIVQDEETSLVFGMPREAILRGAAQVVRPLEKIAEEIAAESQTK